MKFPIFRKTADIAVCLVLAATLSVFAASCEKKNNIPPDDITEGIHSEDVEITQAVHDYMADLVDGMFSDMGSGISEKLNEAIKINVESIYSDGKTARVRMSAVMPEFDIGEEYINSAAQALGADVEDSAQTQNIYIEAVSQYLESDFGTVETSSYLTLEKTDAGWMVTGEEPLYTEEEGADAQ